MTCARCGAGFERAQARGRAPRYCHTCRRILRNSRTAGYRRAGSRWQVWWRGHYIGTINRRPRRGRGAVEFRHV